MAAKNYITETGVNYERKLDTGAERTPSSHVVGYDGESFRMERYKFQTPSNLSKISLTKITFPTGYYSPGYTGAATGVHQNWVSDIKARFLISTSGTAWPDTDKIGTAGYAITSVTNTEAYADVQNLNLEPGTIYYLYVFGGAGYPATFGWRYWNSGNAPTLTVQEEAYTNIGEPTNIKAASYAKPGDSLTVTWDAARKGDNNEVTGYTIDWKIDGKAQESLTTSNTSINLPIPKDAVRGKFISCTITANPQREGYGSAPVLKSNITKINQLPSKPTVAYTPTIVPSTGGQVTFTLSGSDPDGQNISFMCNGTLFTNGTIKVTETTTFNFWINDGLEDGPITKITIIKNNQPTFTVSISDNAISPTITIDPQETLGTSNTYTCSLVYGKIIKNIGTNKTGNFSITDIRSYGIAPDTNYSFTITRNDGIETYSKSDIGKGLKSPNKPSYVKGKHDADDAKYVGELEKYFDLALLPVFSGVNDLDKVKITINNRDFTLDLDEEEGEEGQSQWYFRLSDDALNAFVRGVSTTMKVTFGKGTLFFPAYSFEEKFTRVINGADALQNLVLNDFNLFAGTPMLTFRNVYSSDYKKYGFANDPLNEGTTYTFQVNFNETVPLDVNFYPASIASNDQISYWLNGQEIYGNLVNNLEHEKQHTVSVTVSFFNDLGGIASKTISTVVDCDIDIKLANGTTPPGLLAQDKEISTWNYLLQGMSIKNSSFAYKAYSEDLHAQIYVSRDSGKTWIAYSQIDGEPTGTLSYLNPRTFKFNSTDLTTIGSTSIDYSPQFKIKLFTNKNIEVLEEEIELNKTITVKALIAPAINIVSGIYEKGKITIKYQFVDNNDNTITRNSLAELYIGTEEEAKGSWEVDVNQVITQDYTIDDKIESVLVYLKGIITAGAATTTDTEPSYTISIITKTPAYTIFNIQPTVSYRKNRLGVNSSIDGTGNENYVIKIASSGSSDATQIALVSKNGAVRVIDIEEGTLANFNFVIDCGTWD